MAEIDRQNRGKGGIILDYLDETEECLGEIVKRGFEILKGSEDVKISDRDELYSVKKGYKDICILADKGCPGAKIKNIFESCCINANEQYETTEISPCPYNITSKRGGYLAQ